VIRFSLIGLPVSNRGEDTFMDTPTSVIFRHELPPHDPAQEIQTDCVVSMICGRVSGELDRVTTDHGRTVTYEARIDVRDAGCGMATVHLEDADAQALRDLATVGEFLAEQMDQQTGGVR
jgi:hypothetical protein